MRLVDGGRLYSASDLLVHLGCQYATILNLEDLETPSPKAKDDAHARLVQEKGHEHEKKHLLRYASLYPGAIAEINDRQSLEARISATMRAIGQGPQVIYQAALREDPWHGFADFLIRVDEEADRWVYSYEPLDTKLARSPSPGHVAQLCVYAELLSGLQGHPPRNVHLVLGDDRELSYPLTDFVYYVRRARKRFESFCAEPPTGLRAEPCAKCETCHWAGECEANWASEDHLSLVGNIQMPQVRKLEAAGIRTVQQLADADPEQAIPGIMPETFQRLRAQARLQVQQRTTGERCFEVLPLQEGRGFARLPQPDPGDLFLDLEGDPHFPDGLEYLFGLYGHHDGKPWFRAFWAHDHEAEQRAFEEIADFLDGHFAEFPNAHVYHYNHYEVTAFRRLACRYGTREDSLDRWLRRHRFVDLYQVVREAIRVSESSYSLKSLELFYGSKRDGDVTTAGDSVVVYERWRQTLDDALLKQIEAYNEHDCRSTYELREWLLSLRPATLAWFGEDAAPEVDKQEDAGDPTGTALKLRLLNGPEDERPTRELVGCLLDFHRREAKPRWWAMFDRQNASEDELVDDSECLGGLEQIGEPETVKRSLVFTYRFPEQDTKLQAGDQPLIAQTLERGGEIVALDEVRRTVKLKRGVAKGLLPERMSLIPSGPISTDVQRQAVARFASSLVEGRSGYRAIQDLLQRARPRLREPSPGPSLIPENASPLEATIRLVSQLDESYLFIQGPPGAGKTYTASHVIAYLIAEGKRVGIASNSHKAINNLLRGVEGLAQAQGAGLRGVKKSNRSEPDTCFAGTLIKDVFENRDVTPDANLVAGTAWLFAREEFDQAFDYLFIEEAGQVALANAVAMGVSARNIVLVGDQMQLGQPIQGVHPGESGTSVLEYLLQGKRVIPPDHGVFLPVTWRMHQDLCQFISLAVYDGQLQPEEGTARQKLVLRDDADPALRPTGLSFVPVDHAGCSQKSEAEALRLKELYLSLLGQRFTDRSGTEHPVTMANILVVAPYNVQVNHLCSVLPDGARVGTVDKFQGQEAEVVLISMTTSSGDELPRDIEFLFSRNRLNVAISRARCLAVVLASPRLLEIDCASIEDLRLVNTLCWAEAYADEQGRSGALGGASLEPN